MKNLLVYIHPRKGFDREHAALAKIQIDNCCRLGWDRNDILLVTNFPYEYNDVKALVVDDSCFCAAHDRASKWTTAIQLHEAGLIDDLMWCHDFDAFQLVTFKDDEPQLDGAVAGFTDYGWQTRWNTGSVFFRPEAMDIMEQMVEITNKNAWSEEAALGVLTDNNVGGINDRIKRLNITYNFGYATQRKMNWNANIVDKPIRVAHFHPCKRGRVHRFMPLMPTGLLKIMADHGYGDR